MAKKRGLRKGSKCIRFQRTRKGRRCKKFRVKGNGRKKHSARYRARN